jgi:DNA-binding NarL/FixJ family response regulator
MARKPLSRRWTPADTVLLAKLLREGKDFRQIGRKMKRSAETIRAYAKRLALSQRRPADP